jgi:predicted ATP-dependent endonuclease of OLD family
MTHLRIRNIGPLKDTGYIPITNIMLIIGEQSVGKSTFMKVLSFCRWIEKKVMLQKFDDIIVKGGFIKQLKEFHKLSDEYFKNGEPYVEYTSDVVSIIHKGLNTKTKISKIENSKRHNTKITYIPAERNLLSVIPNLDNKYKVSSYDSMFNCAMEFSEANTVFTKNNPLKLAFAEDMEYYHDGFNDYVKLQKTNTALLLEHTSSGIQSTVPVSVLVHYLCYITGMPSRRTPRMVQSDRDLDFSSENQSNRLNYYNYPQLFIEEPEQHLYPTSQTKLLRDIISQFSMAMKKTGYPGYVVMTSHSPYILTQLNVLLKARKAFSINREETLNIISEECILPLKYYSAYFVTQDGQMKNMMDRETGLIKGEFLDAVSETTEDELNRLNDIIYG